MCSDPNLRPFKVACFAAAHPRLVIGQLAAAIGAFALAILAASVESARKVAEPLQSSWNIKDSTVGCT
jgi:hypothetical protein